jgi:hypothetical protein
MEFRNGTIDRAVIYLGLTKLMCSVNNKPIDFMKIGMLSFKIAYLVLNENHTNLLD